jgi:hypothetical protein
LQPLVPKCVSEIQMDRYLFMAVICKPLGTFRYPRLAYMTST